MGRKEEATKVCANLITEYFDIRSKFYKEKNLSISAIRKFIEDTTALGQKVDDMSTTYADVFQQDDPKLVESNQNKNNSTSSNKGQFELTGKETIKLEDYVEVVCQLQHTLFLDKGLSTEELVKLSSVIHQLLVTIDNKMLDIAEQESAEEPQKVEAFDTLRSDIIY